MWISTRGRGARGRSAAGLWIATLVFPLLASTVSAQPASDPSETRDFSDVAASVRGDEVGFPRIAEVASRLPRAHGAHEAGGWTLAQARRRPTRDPEDARAPRNERVVREYRGFYSDVTVGGELSSIGALDPGFAFNATAGHFLDAVRAEGDFGFRYHGIDTGDDTGDALIFSLMANGVLDIDISRVIHETDLYAGGGVGLAVARANVEDFDGTETGVAFQAKGGVGHRLRPNVHLLLGYRWMLVDFPEMGYEQLHTIEIGARLRF